ncbi:MAG: Gfo/Idh/MocA family oxidoreductase [Bryobacterales bacterium]|nr:Gfo/Idh/MocA family oxidoreductase [Bryobacterales bacterium]
MSLDPTSALSRRTLLSSTAAAFTIVAPQTVRGTQANSKISVGLIGSGNRGTYDAKISNADPRARVTALCDKYNDRIEQAKTALQLDKVDTYNEFEKLLASPSIDAVIIATPPFEHPRMLEATVDAKKHVYCEKPAGVDFEGCKRVMKAGRKMDPKKVLSFGYQQRYGPVYLEAYKRFTAGAIGELSTARASWIAQDPFTRRDYPGLDAKELELRNWFCHPKYSGDIIVEQDCHNFDVLHWFLGGLPIKAIGTSTRKVRTTMDIVDNLSVTLEWPKNVLVNFEANQLTPVGYNKIGEEFTGPKGTITTSRQRMVHYKGPGDSETMVSKRDITFEGIEQFLGRIVSGEVENVAHRSALSTMIAILGRTAMYERKEVTWKGLYGTV